MTQSQTAVASADDPTSIWFKVWLVVGSVASIALAIYIWTSPGVMPSKEDTLAGGTVDFVGDMMAGMAVLGFVGLSTVEFVSAYQRRTRKQSR